MFTSNVLTVSAPAATWMTQRRWSVTSVPWDTPGLGVRGTLHCSAVFQQLHLKNYFNIISVCLFLNR